MEDIRRMLSDAAEQRTLCEIIPRRGPWRRAEIIRVERGGVVLRVTGAALSSGEDVRVWLRLSGHSYTFEASVLRAGVPIPDRSQNGVLLGFLDHWQRGVPASGAVVLEAVPHNGRPVSLLEGEARIVGLDPEHWAFSAPAGFTLIFMEGGTVRLRLGLPDVAPMEVQARVERVTHSDGHLLYALAIEGVGDSEGYRDLVGRLRTALDL